MMAGLQSYFLNRPLLPIFEFSASDTPYHPRRPYYSLIKHKDSISWDHFLRGKLSHHWTHLQQVAAKSAPTCVSRLVTDLRP